MGRFVFKSKKRDKEISALRDEIHAANRIIGVNKVFIEDFPDNRFDTVPLLDIVKVIEKVKAEVNPDTVFTHFADDLNIDHKITANAVLTATRPVHDECVKGVYSFEVLSSTEWNYSVQFTPDTFFDVTGTINEKIKAMACYKSELRIQPHPRSLEGINLNARLWGMKTGVQWAEAFKTLRMIR